MQHSERQLQVRTLDDILTLLHPGERCVVCLPSSDIPPTSLLGSTGLKKKGFIVVTPLQFTEVGSSRSTSTTFSLERTISPAGAIKLLKSKLRRIPKRTFVIVDAREHDRSWFKSEKERVRFFDEAIRLVTKGKFRSAWLVSRTAFPTPKIAEIKDEVEFFLDIGRIGSIFCCQFLKARGIYSAEFFLPHTISWDKNGIEIKSAFIPASSPQKADVSSSANDQAVQNLLEQKYRRVFDSVRDGIIIFQLKGSHRELNRRALEMLGYDQEGLRTLRLSDVVPASSYRSLLKQLSSLRQRGSAVFDLLLVRKSGKTINVNVNASTFKQGLFLAVFRDVSESAKAFAALRDSEAEYRNLIDAAPFPMGVFVEKRLVLRNKEFDQFFSWLANSEVSTLGLFGRRNNDFIKTLAVLNDTFPVQQHGLGVDLTIETPSHEEIALHIAVRATSFKGKQAVECALFNVTAQKNATQRLEESRLAYERLLQHSPDAIAVVRNMSFEYVNSALLRTFGYSAPNEVAGKDVGTIMGEETAHQLFDPEMLKGVRDGDVRTSDIDVKRKDGSSVSLKATLVASQRDSDQSYMLYCHDVTEQNLAHAQFVNNAKAHELKVEVSDAVSGVVTPSELARAALHSMTKAVGFETGAFFGLDENGTAFSITAAHGLPARMESTLERQSVQEGLMGYVQKTQEALLLSLRDYPAHLPYKGLFEAEKIQTAAVVPLTSRGAVHGMLLLATARRKNLEPFQLIFLKSVGSAIGQVMGQVLAYERLRQSELRYRSAIESIPDVVYQAAATGALIYISPQIEHLLGYRPQAFFENPDLWRTILHPDDRPKYGQRITNQAQPENTFALEYRMLPKGKAAYRLVRDVITYERDADGIVVSMTGILHDITDTGGLEIALKKSEESRKRLIESIQDGVAIFDVDFRYVECNKAMQPFVGATSDQLVGKLSYESTPDLITPEVQSLLQRTLAGEAVSTEDLTYVLPSTGSKGYIWARFAPLRGDSGDVDGIVGIFSDVTNRKILELEVRESEETLRNVIDAMGDALMISDLQGRVWEVNREFSRLTGLPRSEALGMEFPYPWVLDEQMAKFVQWIAALREQSELRDFDMTWQTKEGRRFPVSLNTTLLRNAVGEPVAMLNIARDISDRMRLSRELERKNRQIELVNRIISKANATIDFNEIFDTVSAEVLNLIPLLDQINVGLLSEDGEMMTIFACSSPSGKQLQIGAQVPIKQTVSKIAIKQGKAAVINKLIGHRGLRPETASIVEGLRSQISIPIYLKEKVLGTFNIASVKEDAFTGDELSYLQPIADQIGAIIDRVQLFQEVRAQVQRVTSLYELGKSLTGAVDSKSVLPIVYAEARTSIPMHQFYYHVVTADKNLEFGFQAPDTDRPVGDQRVHSPAVLKRVMQRSESVLRGSQPPEAGPPSVMAVPVRSKSRVGGVLSVTHTEPNAFNTNHLRILESIANLTEIALDRARLYEDVVHKSVEIENRNKELDDFTYVVSHDLKEPLISIEGYTKILLQDYKDKIDDEGREYLTTAVQSASRMKHLIDDLLTLSRVGRVAEGPDRTSVQEVIDNVLSELQFTLQEKHCEVHVASPLPTVRYNATQLSMVFRNLISNAVKFNNKPAPRIDIGVKEEGAQYVFSVADNGIGIDKQYFDKVFVIFQRLQRSEEYRGTGAGLTIVKKIVENHRGRIWVESEPGQGATFLFTIPKS